PAGRALAIAARSFDSETPSFVASAARSKPPGPGCAWAPPADDRLEPAVPDCALLCVLAAPPQPAAPSAAEALTTTSLRTFGFMELLRVGTDGKHGLPADMVGALPGRSLSPRWAVAESRRRGGRAAAPGGGREPAPGGPRRTQESPRLRPACSRSACLRCCPCPSHPPPSGLAPTGPAPNRPCPRRSSPRPSSAPARPASGACASA